MHATRGGQDEERNGQAVSRRFWAEALAEHARWLRRVILLRVGEPQAVEEVWQEVACQAVRPPHDLIPPANVASWLYRVAVRQALHYRRKAGRQRRLLGVYAARGGSQQINADPLSWLLARERRELVRTALAGLAVRDAQVLLLKYSESWSYQQIGEHLGLSVSAVEARLHRARQRLRAALSCLEPTEEDHEHH
jgi:RNA polymerase sigma-70 factor, ECF subfamily